MVHLSRVGLEVQLTCRILPAFCQDILVHSFVKQRKPHVSCSGSEKNNWRSGKPNTKVDETEYMSVSENSGFSPQIIQFNRGFPLFSPSILGYKVPIFGNTYIKLEG